MNSARSIVCLLCAVMCLGGCEILYLFTGKDRAPAEFKFKKAERVLVLVDVKKDLAPPPGLATTLADKLSANLFMSKAVDHVISQEKLLALQQADPAGFEKLGTADIARLTDATEVLHIYIIHLDTPGTTDHLVMEGDMTAMVKIVDRDGTVVWPGAKEGEKVSAHANAALLSDRNRDETIHELVEQLTEHTSRIFETYTPPPGQKVID